MTYLRANLEVEVDGNWYGLCADRATDDDGRIQVYVCNGSDAQEVVLQPVR